VLIKLCFIRYIIGQYRMRTIKINFYINLATFTLLSASRSFNAQCSFTYFFDTLLSWHPRPLYLPAQNNSFLAQEFVNTYLRSIMRTTFSVMRDYNTNFFSIQFFFTYANHDHTTIKIILRMSFYSADPLMDFYNDVKSLKRNSSVTDFS